MSPDGVHQNEMPKLPDDQWPTDDPVLASFAEDLRIVASGPAPEPRPGLVAAMRQGVVPIEPQDAGRKKMLVKTLLGGLVAKVAMGVGVATASVAAAGAAGVLPDPAQHAVASVVAAATPFSLPNPSDETTLATEDDTTGGSTTTTSTTSTTLAGSGDDRDGTAGTRAVNHGLCVSTAAQDKSGEGNHGKTVSSVARSDCGKTGTSSATTTVPGGSTTTTIGGGSTTTTVDDGQRIANSGPGNSGNSGRGNSGNSGSGGNGNSGNSGSGNSGRN